MSKKTKKSKTVKSVIPVFHLRFEYLTLFLCLSLALVATIKEYYVKNETVKPAATTESTKKVTQPNAFFYTEVLFARTKTYITFPYRFDGEPLMMVMSLLTKSGYPTINRLVMHPLLYKLEWSHLESPELTLYQRTKRYTSIESFLDNPPAESMILIDSALHQITPGKFKTANILSETTLSIDPNVNYILTSYKPVTASKGWLAYETLLDTSTAEPNIHRELVWQLEVPQASDTQPFYLGEVHVDFRP